MTLLSMTETPSGAMSAGLLHERVRRVGLAVAVGVLHHDDAIAFRLAGVMGAVPNAFRDPDAPVSIDVDVGGVVQQRRGRPQRHFEPFRHLEDVEGDAHGFGGNGWLSGLRWLLRRSLIGLERRTEQHARE